MLAQAAKWAKRAPQRSPTGAPQERLGALRPGLRRQRGANWVPVARWGVRSASWHRARSPRGFDHWCDVMRKMRAWPSVKPPVVPRKHKIPDPIKKNSTMKKICFSQFQNRARVYFRFTDFQIFLIVEFFFMVTRCPRAGDRSASWSRAHGALIVSRAARSNTRQRGCGE